MNRLADVLFSTPWAIENSIFNDLGRLALMEKDGTENNARSLDIRSFNASAYTAKDGNGKISIVGIISKNPVSFMEYTLLSDIKDQFLAALKDPTIKQITLDIDSPGGPVPGVVDLADLIYSSRGKKPITAIVSGSMTSSAYWIGSAANKIMASRGSEIGSIGIFAVMQDCSVRLFNEGVNTELIKTGANKAVGHPAKPITQQDREVIQRSVDQHFSLFADSVKRNRNISDMDFDKIADGSVYLAQDALNLKLIDGIMSMPSTNKTGGTVMSQAQETTRVEVTAEDRSLISQKSHMERAKDYQKMYNCSMGQALSATAEKRKAEGNSAADQEVRISLAKAYAQKSGKAFGEAYAEIYGK